MPCQSYWYRPTEAVSLRRGQYPYSVCTMHSRYELDLQYVKALKLFSYGSGLPAFSSRFLFFAENRWKWNKLLNQSCMGLFHAEHTVTFSVQRAIQKQSSLKFAFDVDTSVHRLLMSKNCCRNISTFISKFEIYWWARRKEDHTLTWQRRSLRLKYIPELGWKDCAVYQNSRIILRHFISQSYWFSVVRTSWYLKASSLLQR